MREHARNGDCVIRAGNRYLMVVVVVASNTTSGKLKSGPKCRDWHTVIELASGSGIYELGCGFVTVVVGR